MPRTRAILTLLALVLTCGVVLAQKSVVMHPFVVTVSSASINSSGTTLTVVLSSATTIANATGWTVAFDNYASRTLTYSSGSGTSSLVFTLDAVSPSTDGRAPVGATCTFDYDAGTGNVPGLADVTAYSVTNSSTAFPDPDLPQNIPTAALPSNWNAAATHSPANNAALQELLDGDGSGDVAAGEVISLDADVDYGTIDIDDAIQGSSNNWIIIRSDEYTSLPTFSTTANIGRVTAGDETYMATISRTPSASGHTSMNISGGNGAVGAGYIRFIGIKFTQYGSYSSDVLAIVSTLTAGFSSDIGELPHHIGFDRCAFTHDNTMKGVQDALRLDCDDSFVVGCNFYGLSGAGNDGSNATRVYNGHRILITNNRFNCNGAAGFLGDNTVTVADDYEFSRNYHFRDTGWDTGHGANKGSIETKTGLRVLIDKNVFYRQYNTGGFGAVTLKSEGTGGPKTTRHVTVRGNKVDTAAMAFLVYVAGSSDDADVGPNSDFLLQDNLAFGITFRAMQLNVYDANSSAPFRRVQFRNNTIIGSPFVFGSDAGATPGEHFTAIDNIFSGNYSLNGGANGAQGFNYSWGSNYSVRYNLWTGQSSSNFDSDTTPSPSGTLSNNSFPANDAAVGYTNTGAGDYSLGVGSSYLTSSSTGGEPGYDSTTYDSIWTEVAQ